MKRLSKTQETARAQLTNDLQSAASAVRSMTGEINYLIESRLNKAVEHYNETLQAMGEFTEEVVTQMQEYKIERCESWPKTPEGMAFDEWIDEWTCVDLAAVPPVDPIIVASDLYHGSAIDNLSSEPGDV